MIIMSNITAYLEMIENALSIENPTPKNISGWAPSYICGIITDNRIV